MSTGITEKIKAVASYATGSFGKDLARRATTEPVTAVLCYHRVTVDQPSDYSEIEAGVPARVFEQQMRFMLKTFRPIAAASVRDDTSPGLRFAVTFDDGTLDGLEVAAPILERLGIPGTFYAVHDAVGTDKVFWWEELAGLIRGTALGQADLAGVVASVTGAPRYRDDPCPLGTIAQKLEAHKDVSKVIRRGDPAFVQAIMDGMAQELRVHRNSEGRAYPLMGWEHLKELVARGHDIGGHTATHPNLALLDEGLIEQEVAASTNQIEAEIDAPVRSFAYPYGMIREPHDAVARALKTCANVRLAYGTGPGLVVGEKQEVWTLPRCGLTRSRGFVWAHNVNRAARETPELSAA